MNSEPPRPPAPPQQRPPPRRTWLSDARTVLSAAGPIFFLPPALVLADRAWSLFGVPALVVYIFIVWAAGIVLIALSTRNDVSE